MSNYAAVAAVSAALRHMLRDPVREDVDRSDVVTDRPPDEQSLPQTPEVRIFLYGVQPNAAWRNNDLPARRGSGDLVQRPQAAIDLHYLLTFYGDERALEPQRLLGSVVRELHARPLLSRETIRQMVIKGIDDDPAFPLADTDLADQVELVRFTPLPLDLDEMSKLWSVFFQAPYRLSIAYQASVVLINPDDASRPKLPVQERRVFATTIRRPRITRIAPVSGASDPITVGTELRIEGSQLRGEITLIWFGPESLALSPQDAGDQEINVVVPATVRAGLVGVRIEHRMAVGDGGARTCGSSNIAAIIVRPRIHKENDAYVVAVAGVSVEDGLHSGNLEMTVEPAAGKRQRVVAHLNPTGAAGVNPGSFTFVDEQRDVPGAPEETTSLSVPFERVPPGAYLVRIEVDGAESPLDRDIDDTRATFEQYILPKVTIA